MAVNLSKGQKVDLTKGKGLFEAMVGLGWNTNKYDGGFDFDLDSAVFMVGADGKCANDGRFVFYNNLEDPSGAVEHMGDNRTGAGDGDDEKIRIDLSKVPADVQKILITVTIYEAEERRQNFGQVEDAYVRVLDSKTNEELVRYDLSEDYSVQTSLVLAEFYRHNGEWKFKAVGDGFETSLNKFCQMYGVSI